MILDVSEIGELPPGRPRVEDETLLVEVDDAS